MMVWWVVPGGLTLNSTGRGALFVICRLPGTACAVVPTGWRGVTS